MLSLRVVSVIISLVILIERRLMTYRHTDAWPQYPCKRKRERNLAPKISWARFLIYWVKFFTARRYASALYAVIVCLSVRPSVRVTSRRCTKTAKHIGSHKYITAYDSPGALSFLVPKISAKL